MKKLILSLSLIACTLGLIGCGNSGEGFIATELENETIFITTELENESKEDQTGEDLPMLQNKQVLINDQDFFGEFEAENPEAEDSVGRTAPQPQLDQEFGQQAINPEELAENLNNPFDQNLAQLENQRWVAEDSEDNLIQIRPDIPQNDLQTEFGTQTWDRQELSMRDKNFFNQGFRARIAQPDLLGTAQVEDGTEGDEANE